MRLSLVAALLLLSGCINLDTYQVPLDPALTTPLSAEHARYCIELAKRQNGLNISDVKAMGTQVTQSSFSQWFAAWSLGFTTSALESAVGFTTFGALLGLHNDGVSRQSQAESDVRQCMSNYHEPLTRKP